MRHRRGSRRSRNGLEMIPSFLGCKHSYLSSRSSSLRYRNTPAWAGMGPGFPRGSILQRTRTLHPKAQPCPGRGARWGPATNRPVPTATPGAQTTPGTPLSNLGDRPRPGPPLGTASARHPPRSRGPDPQILLPTPPQGSGPRGQPRAGPLPAGPAPPPPSAPSHGPTPLRLQPRVTQPTPRAGASSEPPQLH